MKAVIAAAVMHLFAAHHVTGAIAIRDVVSGEIVAASPEERVLPLSTAKLVLAALAWNHGVKTSVDLHALIVTGSDDDGRRLALELRHALGSKAMLDESARLGFDFALAAGTPDAQWADAFSLGETGTSLTPEQLTAFLRRIGAGTLPVDMEAARALKAAMRDCVTEGTAKGSGAALPSGWRMGGRTGSGPAASLPLTDGIFAGLIFDARGRARYAVATYVRKGGRGGAAAEISAEAAAIVIEDRSHGL